MQLKHSIRLACPAGLIDVIKVPVGADSWRAHERRYGFSKLLCTSAHSPTFARGLLVNGEPLALFGGGGISSAVHSHSGLVLGDRLFLAIGQHVVCIRTSPFEFLWALKTDEAMCFAVRYCEPRRALISHGELEISRFTAEGTLLWSASGADVFSEDIDAAPHFVAARDFRGGKYHFDYVDGHELIRSASDCASGKGVATVR